MRIVEREHSVSVTMECPVQFELRPEDVAKLVAAMNSTQQARFFWMLANEFDKMPRGDTQLCHIGEAVRADYADGPPDNTVVNFLGQLVNFIKTE